MMSEVAQLQDDLRQELEWAKRNGYDDTTEIIEAYKDKYPHYAVWFDEVAEESY